MRRRSREESLRDRRDIKPIQSIRESVLSGGDAKWEGEH
jgi:hypothetical protein